MNRLIKICFILILSINNGYAQIPLNTYFKVSTPNPVDDRMTIPTLSDTVNIIDLYDGLLTVVQDTDQVWQYDGGKWVEFEQGGSSVGFIYTIDSTVQAVGLGIYSLSTNNRLGLPAGTLYSANSTLYNNDTQAAAVLDTNDVYFLSVANDYGLTPGIGRALYPTQTYGSDDEAILNGVDFGDIYAVNSINIYGLPENTVKEVKYLREREFDKIPLDVAIDTITTLADTTTLDRKIGKLVFVTSVDQYWNVQSDGFFYELATGGGGGTDDQTASEVPYVNNEQTTVESGLDSLYNRLNYNYVIQQTAPDSSLLWLDSSSGIQGIWPYKIRINNKWQTLGWYDTVARIFSTKKPVFVLGIGQSNMLFRAATGDGVGGTDPKVVYWNGSSWEVPNLTTTNSLAFQFAKTMANKENRVVRFFQSVQGATAIEEWFPGNPLYNSIFTQIEANGIDSVDYILWRQGESNLSDTRSEYESKFYSVINSIRDSSQFSYRTPVILGGFVANYRDDGPQLFLESAHLSNDALFYADNSDLFSADGVHFENETIDTSGYRMYKALSKFTNKPRLIEETRADGGNVYNRNDYLYEGGGSYNIVLGYDNFTNASAAPSNSVAIGRYAFEKSTDILPGVAIGFSAGRNNISGRSNTFVGSSAGVNSISGNNVAIGAEAGSALTNSFNVFVGNSAGISATNVSNTTVFGRFAGRFLGTGGFSTENLALGNNSMAAMTIGSRNVAIGANSLNGALSAVNTTSVGIGSGLNSSSSSSVFLGYQAGEGELNNNRLHIANSNTDSLIYGEFDNNYLLVNSVLDVNTGYRVENSAPAGEYLRGDGTNFVSSAIQEADLPVRFKSNYTFTPFPYTGLDTIPVDTSTLHFVVDPSIDAKTVTQVYYQSVTNVTDRNLLVALLSWNPDTDTYTNFGSGIIPIGSNSVTVTTSQALTEGHSIFAEVGQSGGNVSGLTVKLKIE